MSITSVLVTASWRRFLAIFLLCVVLIVLYSLTDEKSLSPSQQPELSSIDSDSKRGSSHTKKIEVLLGWNKGSVLVTEQGRPGINTMKGQDRSSPTISRNLQQGDFEWSLKSASGSPTFALDDSHSQSEIRFSFIYGGTVVDGSKYLQAKLFKKDCLTPVSSNAVVINSASVLAENHWLIVDVNVLQSTLKAASDEYQEIGPSTANIYFCLRVDYYYYVAGAMVQPLSVNFIDLNVTATMDTSANFSVKDVQVQQTAADSSQDVTSITCHVQAYFCGASNQKLIPNPTFVQGNVMSVCVEIAAQDAALYHVTNILSMIMEQTKSDNTTKSHSDLIIGTQALPLSEKSCRNGICRVQHQLESKFFDESVPKSLVITGQAACALGPLGNFTRAAGWDLTEAYKLAHPARANSFEVSLEMCQSGCLSKGATNCQVVRAITSSSAGLFDCTEYDTYPADTELLPTAGVQILLFNDNFPQVPGVDQPAPSVSPSRHPSKSTLIPLPNTLSPIVSSAPSRLPCSVKCYFSCLHARDCSVASGLVKVCPSNNGTNYTVYCDQVTAGGGWMLLYSYKHVAYENAALVPGTIPLDPLVGYSHINFNQIAGYSLADITAVRFYCYSKSHTRILHFISYEPSVRRMAFDGNQTRNKVSAWTSSSTGLTVLMPDHTADLPLKTTAVYSNTSQGFLSFPFYSPADGNWAIRAGTSSNKWNCDNDPLNAYTSLHNVWVKSGRWALQDTPTAAPVSINPSCTLACFFSCQEAYQYGCTASTTYKICPGNTTYTVYCDQGNANGGWMLIYSYQRGAGANKAIVEDQTIPTVPGTSYSHIRVNFLKGYVKSDIAAVRFYCRTPAGSPHNRVVHFVNTHPIVLGIAFDGNQTLNVPGAWTNSTLLANHTGYLPASVTAVATSASGHFHNKPFSNGYSWNIGDGSSWNCDHQANSPYYGSTHFVWVRMIR